MGVGALVSLSLLAAPASTEAGASVHTFASGSTSASWSSLPTYAQLAGQLTKAAHESSVPSSTDPPVADWANLDSSEWTGPDNAPTGCWPAMSATSVPVCVFGDTSAKRTAAVVGDSQAWMWVPALSAWGLKYGWRIRVFAKSGCSAWAHSPEIDWQTGLAYPQCGAFDAFVMRELKTIHPAYVIADSLAPASGRETYVGTSSLESELSQFAKSVTALGAKTVFFSNIPYLAPPNVAYTSPDCLARETSRLSHCTATRSDPGVFSKENNSAYAYVTSHHVAPVIAVQNLECGPADCPMIVGSRLIYSDASHVNRVWSTYVARALSQLLAAAITS